jgi:hypothetical protein
LALRTSSGDENGDRPKRAVAVSELLPAGAALSRISLAVPKSVILASGVPLARRATMMFAGLSSRRTMPWPWVSETHSAA